MPVSRVTLVAALCCVLVSAACRGSRSECPQGSVVADPREIPAGSNTTSLFVEVYEPNPFTGLELATELASVAGVIEDPFARATTYACAHDWTGPIEVCVTTTYIDEEDDDDRDGSLLNVAGAIEYLRTSHVRIPDPIDCSTTECTEVVCPSVKNECPVVSSITVDPSAVPEGGTATIRVDASDPDENPESLTTTLRARHGTIDDPHASVAEYACDPEVGGAIEICVVASDGDTACDAEQCTTVRCPGDPLENTCPIIESLTADPVNIPDGQSSSWIVVSATDPDDFPVPMRTELSATAGVFDDRFASETRFHCGDSGPMQVCARANDGDPDCDVESCITVQCPSDIPANVCPNVNVINALTTFIPPGSTSTEVQTRGWDTDRSPLPLTLTLTALWGSLENTENKTCPVVTPDCLQSPNVVFQDAVYVCDRPGEVELCVDGTDGACTKSLCTTVFCPDDITPP